MQEEVRNCGCNNNNNCGCGCNNGGFLGGIFGGRGRDCDCGCDSEILFFIIVFLLLFTNFGCCGRRDCC